MPRFSFRAAGVGASCAALAACAGYTPPATGARPAGVGEVTAPPGAAAESVLPPIPAVRGPLALTVVYPKAGATVAVRDSTFIFGSVGSGDATLTINGAPVAVEPNGAFLAWLPVPDSALARYDLVAARGADTARLTQPIVIPSRRPASDSADSAMAREPFPDSGRYEAVGLGYTGTLSDTDRAIPARPTPAGTYKWFLAPGTVVRVTGRAPGGFWRIALDSSLSVWVNAAFVRPPPGTPPITAPPRHVVTMARVKAAPGWVDLAMPVGAHTPPAYLVEEDGHDLQLTLYGTTVAADVIQYDSRDTLIRSVTWEPQTSDRGRFTVHLSAAPFGYLILWDAAAGRLVLRVRRPPVIDPAEPLRGRTIVVDAGHPPIGATGPTGLWEPVPTLAVSRVLDSILTARGARVVMTRTTADPVDLEARPAMARRSDGDVLVSIHFNALPDGLNPFTSQGTGTYFFHPHSIGLARAVQAGMLSSMRLRDRGIFYENFALTRTTWMPAVLCEGAFIILPIQEAALRTPEFRARYAVGVADGIESYLRSLAAAR